MKLGRMKRSEIERLIEMNGETPSENLVRLYIISIRDDLNWVRGPVRQYMNATAAG